MDYYFLIDTFKNIRRSVHVSDYDDYSVSQNNFPIDSAFRSHIRKFFQSTGRLFKALYGPLLKSGCMQMLIQPAKIKAEY